MGGFAYHSPETGVDYVDAADRPASQEPGRAGAGLRSPQRRVLGYGGSDRDISGPDGLFLGRSAGGSVGRPGDSAHRH